ncbi:MAG: hypothetical protein ACI9MR_000296 [Myxococcota bacterium]|jgi:hypothetical protein
MRHRTKWSVLLGLLVIGTACGASEPSAPAVGSEAKPSLPSVASEEGEPAQATSKASNRAARTFGGDVTRLDLVEALDRDAGERWYGVYMQGRKVGHGRILRQRHAPDSGLPGDVAIGMDLTMRVIGRAADRPLEVSERRFYSLDPPFGLVETTYELHSVGLDETRRAVNSVDGMTISRVMNGASQPAVTLPASKERLSSLLAIAPLLPSDLPLGSVAKVSMWDWEHQRDDIVAISAKTRTTRRRSGVDEDVLVLEMDYARSGILATSRVSANGATLEMAVGTALALRQEDPAVAKSGIEGLDVLGSGIAAGRALGPANKVSQLVLNLKLPERYVLPVGKGQQAEPVSDEGWTKVTLTRGPRDVVTEEARKLGLVVDSTHDWKHPSVQALARELSAGLSTPREKVDAVVGWVYNKIDKRLATHLPSASVVIARRFGDCSEHTWLGVALLRAMGIPARPVYGVAYAGDIERVFAYHAWVEVALDGRWWAVDPTWNETMADATHLKLGEELAAVGLVLGSLELKILSHL